MRARALAAGLADRQADAQPQVAGGDAAGLLGWPLEIVALLLAPLTVVQPCLVSGLVVLLWLGVTRLGERPGRREYLARGGDRRRGRRGRLGGARAHAPTTPGRWRSRSPSRWSRSRSPLPTCCAAGSRRSASSPSLSAGFGYAWTAIASKLLTDELAAGALLVAARLAGHRAGLRGPGPAQRDERPAAAGPATHVAPVMFAVQVLVPVILAPLIFEESWSDDPARRGAALVAFMLVAADRHDAAGGLEGGRRRARVRPRGRLIGHSWGIWSGFAASLARALAPITRQLPPSATQPPSSRSHRGVRRDNPA